VYKKYIKYILHTSLLPLLVIAGKLPIRQTHQVATVLPPRTDGKVWVGTVTWASSKQIEVEM